MHRLIAVLALGLACIAPASMAAFELGTSLRSTSAVAPHDDPAAAMYASPAAIASLPGLFPTGAGMTALSADRVGSSNVLGAVPAHSAAHSSKKRFVAMAVDDRGKQ